MSKYTVVGLGEVLWDVFPEGRRLGGAPANFAYHAHALGAEGRLVSRVGDDDAGREIIGRLVQLGIPAEHVSKDPAHPTGMVDIQLDSAGKPSYRIREGVAWDHIPYTAETARLAVQADAVCFGTLCSRCETSRSTIRQFLENTAPDALRILDINLRQDYYSNELIGDLLGHANVLKLSDDELPVAAKLLGLPADEPGFFRAVSEAYQLSAVALTKGGEGSVLYAGGRTSAEPPGQGDIVDTVGAGDSFTAALTLGLLKGWPLARINKLANRTAAYVCGRSGATPDLPDHLRREFVE